MTAKPLPPLPPVFGVRDDEVRPGGRSMLELLVDDHHQLVQLCAFLAADRDRSGEDVLVATASRHLRTEEQYLYPAMRAVFPDGDTVADQEITADMELLHSLRRLELTARDHPRYAELVKAVQSRVRRHVHRIDHDVFPRLRERCTSNELIRLGNRGQIARETAPTRPHQTCRTRRRRTGSWTRTWATC